MKVRAIILAAGRGTRMRSQIPKVLHQLAGKPLVQYSIDTVKAVCDSKPVLVIGYQADLLRAAIGDQVEYAIQEEQLGTAHAVGCTESILRDKGGLIIVQSADMPLISIGTLKELVRIQSDKSGPVTFATTVDTNSRGFGRILRGKNGDIDGIVEEAQASSEQLAIQEINVGVYCFRADWLYKAIKRINKSSKGEFYLTDTIELARKDGYQVSAIHIDDPAETLGINSRVHLAEAEAILRRRINEKWMLNGVTIQDPDTTYIGVNVQLESDTTILANTQLIGDTIIGSGSVIGPNTVITDTHIGEKCMVTASFLEEATLEEGVVMGPYCHMRSGAHLAKGVHMGNFGEVKNSYLGPGTKMGHFSYIGDAQIGKDVNISAGVITCNFDGEKKHATVIGDGAFVGSDSMLVAPVKIGNRSRSGAGSVVTKDIPDDTLVVGVPAHELKKLK
jgi:bifunctional UDP-N-acetylglucosamine pyrophosphorylase/glucosamine-1-phosphate N-acetyltransferase